MKYVDDRNEQQQETHNILITATDKCMSGWGGAAGGASKCAWACDSHAKADKLLDWVENRSDMKYVNIHYRNNWKPRNAAHVHIYVVEDTHPAL
tara:strand:- start:2987 stop:3268 length:282 start_codon:yes stop_codon:yes gene_type:complete